MKKMHKQEQRKPMTIDGTALIDTNALNPVGSTASITPSPKKVEGASRHKRLKRKSKHGYKKKSEGANNENRD
jgi:hypothetical protein